MLDNLKRVVTKLKKMQKLKKGKKKKVKKKVREKVREKRRKRSKKNGVVSLQSSAGTLRVFSSLI